VNKLIYEIFSGLPRFAPGSFETTKKAYSALQDLPSKPNILDLGCGSGAQTFDLAKLTDGSITAVDNYEPYVDDLNKKAKSLGIHNRVKGEVGDMTDLKFNEKTFDLIWAEGSIYIIGFEKGLKTFKKLLKPKGFIALTEVCWLKDNPPDEIKNFWDQEYPDLKDVEKNKKIIADCGYKLLDNFTLPNSCWLDELYNPLEKRLPSFREKYKGKKEAEEFIDSIEKEISMSKKYLEYYGYEFYIMETGNG